MELHPLLSKLDKKDRERYVIACKNDLIDFLEDLGLSNGLALQVLEDVRTSLLNNNSLSDFHYFHKQTSYKLLN